MIQNYAIKDSSPNAVNRHSRKGDQRAPFISAPTALSVTISMEAERYARTHQLWNSLAAIQSITSVCDLAKSIKIELVSDPEIQDLLLLCFTINTAASVADVLQADEQLHQAISDRVPPEDQLHFAVVFDFDQV